MFVFGKRLFNCFFFVNLAVVAMILKNYITLRNVEKYLQSLPTVTYTAMHQHYIYQVKHCMQIWIQKHRSMQLIYPIIASCNLLLFRTLLLIMREMIQTERDYVKSLDYIIENYIPELMREDIPQALRGQRNVVFGNVEKIYEFHSQHFLRELEQVENNPLQVGQIFLKYDKKFYLYALYNKNKPKSDSLMSEYGSTFFKVSKNIDFTSTS